MFITSTGKPENNIGKVYSSDRFCYDSKYFLLGDRCEVPEIDNMGKVVDDDASDGSGAVVVKAETGCNWNR